MTRLGELVAATKRWRPAFTVEGSCRRGSVTVIKTFEVPDSYVEQLRASAVPESLARMFPESPFTVDVNLATDQFGIRPIGFDNPVRHIIPARAAGATEVTVHPMP
jgi:hypothetical protein